jgi:PD-(D/E)XK endonuclease
MVRMTPRRQGDLGEFSAIEWLGTHGYAVYAPLGHSPDADLVADDGTDSVRVQVKTTTLHRHRRWEVTLCTRGGNRSWNGIVKRFSSSRCDWLFVLVADGRRWFIPAAAVGGGTGIMLGGPKYAQFEVETGRRLL